MDDSILDFFFPTFVLCLRDVTLHITQGSDQFLEENLQLQNGTTDGVPKYNHPRQLIRRYYKKRKCFVFEQPVEKTKLPGLMEIPENELNKEFQDTLNTFRDYVFSSAPKTLKCGRGVNGRMFSTLLVSYVNSVNDGHPPNIQVAMKTMADAENAHAIQKATKFYETEMKRKLASHSTPTESGLIGFHKDSMNAALSILKSELVFDDKQIYEEQAMSLIKQHLKRFKDFVDRNSRSICQQRLQQLNMRIVQKMKNRAYHDPSGYDEYMTDIKWIAKQYRKEKIYLGTKDEVCLQEFFDGKVSEEETVYQWVVEAQTQQSGNKTKSEPSVKRITVLLEEMKAGQDEAVESKDDQENIERDINNNIKSMQVAGMKSIGSQYMEMLKMKLEELERMRKELTKEDPLFKKLEQETECWNELSKNAMWNLPKYKANSQLEEKKEKKGKCPIM